MKTIGLDLSINSTGICINNGKNSFKYYLICSNPTNVFKNACKQSGLIEIFQVDKKKSYKEDPYEIKEMFKSINIFNIIKELDKILKENKNIEHAYIEGISYGSSSTSALTDLAGLNYLVRHTLVKHKIPFTIVSPKANKKLAVGNGNADKDQMILGWTLMDKRIEQFIKDNSKIKLKIDDLADAFFLSKYQSDVKCDFTEVL